MSGRRIILIFCLLLLSSCQQWRYPAPAGWVNLANGYYQLADSWPGQPQQLFQQVSWFSANNQQQLFISMLLKEEGYLLVALSPLGQELWRMQYSKGHKLELDGIAPFNQAIFARRLLAEMQLALLEEQQLTARLHNIKVQQQGTQRQILRHDGTLLLTVSQPAQLATEHEIIIQTDSYKLQIKTLQQDFL